MFNLLPLIVQAVDGSPACWTVEQLKEAGFNTSTHVCPDVAYFDFWLETPGTGWYQMCEEAGYAGYDGINPAWAVELDSCYLSWNESSDSLSARLKRSIDSE